YKESKKGQTKIKKAHQQETASNQSQPVKKEPPQSENKKILVKQSLKDQSIPKGHYLQIGAFLNAPSKDILQTLKNFSHHMEKK
ncbi:sporulation protein, partial [Helicobacter pylori]